MLADICQRFLCRAVQRHAHLRFHLLCWAFEIHCHRDAWADRLKIRYQPVQRVSERDRQQIRRVQGRDRTAHLHQTLRHHTPRFTQLAMQTGIAMFFQFGRRFDLHREDRQIMA